MKAIQTRYHGATNTKGSRISATAEGVGRVYVSYPHELSGDSVYFEAVKKLCSKVGWTGSFACGGLPDGSNAFVFVVTQNGDNGEYFTI